jgi:hypothetical protein
VAIVPGHAFSDRALDRQFNPTHLVNYRRTRHPRSCSGQYRNRTCQSGARTSPSVPDNSPCAKATATARARRLARWGCLYGRRRRARGNSTRIYLHQTCWAPRATRLGHGPAYAAGRWFEDLSTPAPSLLQCGWVGWLQACSTRIFSFSHVPKQPRNRARNQ